MENWQVPLSSIRLIRLNSIKSKNEQVVTWAAEPVNTAFYRSVPSVLCFSYSLNAESCPLPASFMPCLAD